MRSLVLVVVLAACSSKTEQRRDLELFCSPETAAHGSKLSELGPAIIDDVHRTEFGKVLELARQGAVTPAEFVTIVGAQLAAEHITDCPTYDNMRR